MTPAEKAKELVGRLKPFVNTEAGEFYDSHYDAAEEAKNAKQCALIAVEEIINSLSDPRIIYGSEYRYEADSYWMTVKKELEKL